MDNKKYDVFISYSHDDQIVANGILAHLEKNKIRCFIDYRDIPKGSTWPSVIPPAIHNSKMMLAIFSKSFNVSEQTDNEITIASKCKIPILVFRLTDDSFEGTKEYFLLKSNWIEAFPHPEECFGELHHNICILLGINNEADTQHAIPVLSSLKEMSKEEEWVQNGLKILQDENADRDEAAYLFRKAAKAGYPEGEYHLGVAYYQGCGIPHSWEDAILWLTKAAEHGHSGAMELLARIYRYGIGTERNIMRALELYTHSAQAGNGKAMKALGRVFHTGELGVQDEPRSKEYYDQAFETLYEQAMGENNGIAQQELGKSYFDGEGVKQSYDMALKLYKRATNNHNATAFNSMGLCFNNGFGVEIDLVRGFEFQLKSAELGFPVAMGNVAYDYLNGYGVEKNEKKYWEWIKRGADCGDASSQHSIGMDYSLGERCEKDMQLAHSWLQRAISSGSYEAMSYLGILYENGHIVIENAKQEAFQLFKQAAMGGDVYSYIYLANCYFWGKGTDQNDVEAARWYQKAVEVYEQMKSKGENHFISECGGGVVSYINFNDGFAQFLAGAYENLAWIYRNSDSVEHDEKLADKYETTAKKLKGTDLDVEKVDDVNQLKQAALKGNVEAMDKLLSVLGDNNEEEELVKWATFAMENKILVCRADRMNNIDHIELVLQKAQVKDHQVYVDFIKAYLDNDGSTNADALYNAACEEYKKGNLTMTKKYWKLVRSDAESLLGLDGTLYGAGYLRKRREHFDVLFPDYRPTAIANGDFSNERDFKLFYAANTSFISDSIVNDLATSMFDPMKNDKSYWKVVESKDGWIVNSGNIDRAITSFIHVYNMLCEDNPSVRKVMMTPFAFDMLVPICSPVQIQDYCMQAMKALISLRNLYNDKWQEILQNLANHDRLLDIAEITKDESLQLLLICYVEMQIEADRIFDYSDKLILLCSDNNKLGIASELNAYVKRLNEKGIEHDLPYFTVENIPKDCCFDPDEDEELDDDDVDYEDYEDYEEDDSITNAQALVESGDDYYFGRNGKPQDYNEAVKFYMQSAELGLAYAQYSLAFCYEKGQGVEANENEAAKWYGLAAEQGHANSQCNYGLCCELGKGVPKNLEEAVKWYRKAAEQGDKVAQCNLGYCYLEGIGTVKNNDEAFFWFNKSAEQGWPRAQSLLGNCYFKGTGTKKDFEQAKVWYEKAVAQGWEPAKKSLQELLDNEKNPNLDVVKNGDRYGYADRNGKIVVPCQYTFAQDFYEGIGLVWEDKKVGAVDVSGKLVLPCKISCVVAKYLGHGLIKIQSSSSLYNICDLEGKDIEYELYTEMGDKFIDGYVPAVKYRLIGKNKPGKIDTSGKFHPD